eukprot:CAMPEP_0198253212 /NCGR_PEP_ID=MMETSP1447-20131203/3673_1 /TAXON_ID=420782 /ORGANISM="Chaetoceros dichaeta, Strain CCMP1751" /LENGTH=113 /DNA_ID=CAMNT_0043938795 /DNA_START=435 /DNA_END=776 /DNA_ORIENTATION=-
MTGILTKAMLYKPPIGFSSAKSGSFHGQTPVITAGRLTLHDLHRSRTALLRLVEGFSLNNMEPRARLMGGGVRSSSSFPMGNDVGGGGLSVPEAVSSNVYVSSPLPSFSLSSC